jgi:CRISPR/Cas system-associated exonuclease Cas4 (RecB family)
MSERFIRASEISEYVYCRRAWWLRQVAGRPSHNVRQMAAGAAYHQRHGSRTRWAGCLRQLALILLFLAITSFVFWLLQAL